MVLPDRQIFNYWMQYHPDKHIINHLHFTRQCQCLTTARKLSVMHEMVTTNHSILIHDADRHLTTYITPWGRYCTTPQGYLAAGDAYTRRFDEIIAGMDSKTKYVDDTLMWSTSIEKSFYQTCQFLTKCGNNWITLNPQKFQFAKDNVEFTRFEVTATNVRPSKKYLSAIVDFPIPTDISGIRSWFGLINQVSYAFSLTSRMQPFRDLLKPGNKFYWDENFQKIFEESKKKIIIDVQKVSEYLTPIKELAWVHTGTKLELNFSSTWTITSESREHALTKRYALERERLAEHTKILPPLKVGDHMYRQNQIRNYLRKWHRSGIIVEAKNDQYGVKMMVLSVSHQEQNFFAEVHPLCAVISAC